jgi:hypothetical protein
MDEDLPAVETFRVPFLQLQEHVEAVHRRSTCNAEKVKRLCGLAGESGSQTIGGEAGHVWEAQSHGELRPGGGVVVVTIVRPRRQFPGAG